MGLRMAARLNEVVQRIARHLTKIFSGISATIASTPIPVSDIYVLIVLQTVLVSMIACLVEEIFRWIVQRNSSLAWAVLQGQDMHSG